MTDNNFTENHLVMITGPGDNKFTENHLVMENRTDTVTGTDAVVNSGSESTTEPLQKAAPSIADIMESKRLEKKKQEQEKREKNMLKNREFDDLKFRSLNVVDKAEFLWKKFKKKRQDIINTGVNYDHKTHGEKMLNEFRYNYKEFCETYPILVRYICQFQSYNKVAFERYLRKIKNLNEHYSRDPSGMSKESYKKLHYVDRNADYIKYLWEETNRNKIPKSIFNQQAENVYKEVYKLLEKEHEYFTNIEILAEEKAVERANNSFVEKKNELMNLIRSLKENKGAKDTEKDSYVSE